MAPDTIFQICSAIAMAGWLLLIIASPFLQGIDRFLISNNHHSFLHCVCLVYRFIFCPWWYEELWQPGWCDDIISKQNGGHSRLGALPGFWFVNRYLDKKEFNEIPHCIACSVGYNGFIFLFLSYFFAILSCNMYIQDQLQNRLRSNKSTHKMQDTWIWTWPF